MNGCRVLGLALLLAMVVGCAGQEKRELPIKPRQFQVEDLAKTDIDMAAEVQLRFTLETLQQLMVKLYRRNPVQWQRGEASSLEAAVDRLFGVQPLPRYRQLDGEASLDLMRQAFAEEYTGDRVLALIAGLRGMIIAAHNGKESFYFTDELDPQRLYHAARNIEIAVWRLSNSRDSLGQLYIISNQTNGPLDNLSYERLFGKLIALQDSIARIIAERTNRRIKNVIQSVASAVFLPI